jgi:hypothetical protein
LEKVRNGRPRVSSAAAAQQRVDKLVTRLAGRYRDDGLAVPLDYGYGYHSGHGWRTPKLKDRHYI